MNLEVGSKAPAFSLEGPGGRKYSLDDFHGRWLVLYFYPKDSTPGCTAEACEFRDAKNEFDTLGAAVAGISPDDAESHASFAQAFDLNFTLLSDPGRATLEDYGVWAEKNMYGKKYMGVKRATCIIDPEGKIAHVWPNVNPENHAAQVAEKLRELQAANPWK